MLVLAPLQSANDRVRFVLMGATQHTDSFGALERLMRSLRRDMGAELAQALVASRADEEVQNRYDELADKNTAGTLTAAERAELEALVQANEFLETIKLEARFRLERAGTN